MKRKRGILAIVLCLLLLISACSAPKVKTKLYIGFWPDGSLEGETQFYEEIKKNFEREYTQYEIVPAFYDYNENTVTAKYVSGQLPTVFSVRFAELATPFKNGYVKDVGKMLQDYGWYDTINEDVLQRISDGEKVYGVPFEQYSLGFLVNLKTLYEAGVLEKNADGTYALYGEAEEPLYPNTFEKIRLAAERIYEYYEGEVKAFCLPTAEAESGRLFLNHVYNWGCENIEQANEEGWVADFDVQTMGAALRWIKEMGQEGYIDNAVSYGNNDWVALFAQGKTAMAFCGSDILKTLLSAYSDLKEDVAFLPMPSAEGVSSRSLWDGNAYVINQRATDAQVEGIFTFLEYIGETPTLREKTKDTLEKLYSAYSKDGTLLFPKSSVWQDEAYNRFYGEIFLQYKNPASAYFQEFFVGYEERKREEEPYYNEVLCKVLNELQKTMLFHPNEYDIVNLISNAEKEFTEQYLVNVS